MLPTAIVLHFRKGNFRVEGRVAHDLSTNQTGVARERFRCLNLIMIDLYVAQLKMKTRTSILCLDFVSNGRGARIRSAEERGAVWNRHRRGAARGEGRVTCEADSGAHQ